MNKTTFSVFGSWGFIGSEICKDPDFHHNEPNKVEYRNKFISDTKDIVYCISTTHNYNVIDNDPYVDIDTNLHHLMTVLQANRMKYGNEFTFTLISTWFVYGNVELPANEDSCCSPKGFYSITKKAAEDLLISYCDTYGIKWRIVRLSNVLGEADIKVSNRRNALQYMIKTLCEGREINLYDEDCQRDYLHVEDVADGIIFAVKYGAYSEIYNIGSGYGSSIHKMVRRAHQLSNFRGKINLVSVPKFHKTVQVKDMYLDTYKINELGWYPMQSSDEIVERLCKYYTGINE